MSPNPQKKKLEAVSNQAAGTRSSMEQFRPEFAKQRADIAKWQAAPRADTIQARTDLGAARDVYAGQIADPNKLGYTAETVNAMKAKQLGASQGAATDLRRNLDRTSAATGMGSTGAAMRNAMTSNERLSSELLGVNRDVDLAQAQASREDLASATQGMGAISAMDSNIGKGEDAFRMAGIDANQQALQGETGLFNAETGTYGAQNQALGQANKAGFWGTTFQNLLGAGGQVAAAYARNK